MDACVAVVSLGRWEAVTVFALAAIGASVIVQALLRRFVTPVN